MKKKEFAAATHKLQGGPGGWRCPCCNPFGMSPRRMKVKARRMVRRIEKQKITTEL